VRKLGLRARAAVKSVDRAARERAARERGSLKTGVAWATVVVAGSAVLFGIPTPVTLTAPGARAAIETLIATSALISAAVLLVSFRQLHRQSDLLLLIALAALGLSDLVFSALPAWTGSQLLGVGSAPHVTCDGFAAVAVAAAAFSPAATRAGIERRTLRFAGVAAASAIAVASIADLLAGQHAVGGASPGVGIAAAAQHPALLFDGIFSSVVLLVSAVAFLRKPERSSQALAAAAFLLAAARLQYLALPAMAPNWVTARDALRLAAYSLLLVAALLRYAQTRRTMAAAALVVERERIARDLHDGLAQDLAFIALKGQQLESELGSEHPLTVAARRALAASRGVIVDLSASTAASTEMALRQVADELAARFGTEIDVIILDDPGQPAGDDLDPGRREEVVRIAREAVVNAIRHGGAAHVAIVLEHAGDHVRLRVTDDGRGAPEAKLPRPGVHGLQMMRARAAAIGGRLTTGQPTEGGVEIELSFPVGKSASSVRTTGDKQAVRHDGDRRAGETRVRQRARGLLGLHAL
jgi:signal transduction histidine kinase